MAHIIYRARTELESDGRWIAEMIDVPGVVIYGSTEKEAIAAA
jgi:predicted RNase H-like HicB family nuclease